jgi:basic amino acid/polyamine antiporter, APA family
MAFTRQSPSHVGAAPSPASVYAAAPASPAKPADGLGLSAATALVVGSIVGVGIFNLPTSLAAFGPISLISMGLTTIGAIALAMLFAALSRRMPADGGPYAMRARHDLPSTSAAVSGGDLS